MLVWFQVTVGGTTSPQPMVKKVAWIENTMGFSDFGVSVETKQSRWGRNLMNSRVEKLNLLQHGLVHQT